MKHNNVELQRSQIMFNKKSSNLAFDCLLARDSRIESLLNNYLELQFVTSFSQITCTSIMLHHKSKYRCLVLLLST